MLVFFRASCLDQLWQEYIFNHKTNQGMKIDFNRFWIHDKIRTLSESWFDSRTSSFSGFVNVLLDKFVWAALLQSSTHETSFLTNPVQKRSVVGKQLVLFWTARPEHAHIHGASIHLRTRAIHRSHYILSHAIPIVDRFHIIWQTLSVWNIMLAMLHHIFYHYRFAACTHDELYHRYQRS